MRNSVCGAGGYPFVFCIDIIDVGRTDLDFCNDYTLQPPHLSWLAKTYLLLIRIHKIVTYSGHGFVAQFNLAQGEYMLFRKGTGLLIYH